MNLFKEKLKNIKPILLSMMCMIMAFSLLGKISSGPIVLHGYLQVVIFYLIWMLIAYIIMLFIEIIAHIILFITYIIVEKIKKQKAEKNKSNELVE